jgi:hypothetical protein
VLIDSRLAERPGCLPPATSNDPRDGQEVPCTEQVSQLLLGGSGSRHGSQRGNISVARAVVD